MRTLVHISIWRLGVISSQFRLRMVHFFWVVNRIRFKLIFKVNQLLNLGLGKRKTLVSLYLTPQIANRALLLYEDDPVRLELTRFGIWEGEIIQPLADFASGFERIHVVDVGANQGLFSLFLSYNISDTTHCSYLLIEPHPLFMALAKFNTSELSCTYRQTMLCTTDRPLFQLFGSSTASARDDLFYDLPGKRFKSLKVNFDVETSNPLILLKEHLQTIYSDSRFDSAKLILKTDTDGLDVEILKSLQPILSQFEAVVFELIFSDPSFSIHDREYICSIIRTFDNLLMSDHGTTTIDFNEILHAIQTRFKGTVTLLCFRSPQPSSK